MKNHLVKLAAFFDSKKMNSYKREVVKIANEFGMGSMEKIENPYEGLPDISYEDQDKERAILLKNLLSPTLFTGLGDDMLLTIVKKAYSNFLDSIEPESASLKLTPDEFVTNPDFKDRVHTSGTNGDHLKIEFSFNTTKGSTSSQLLPSQISKLKGFIEDELTVKMYSIMQEGEGYDGTDYGEDRLEEPLDVNYTKQVDIKSHHTMSSSRGAEVIPYHKITVVIQILLHSAAAEAAYSSEVAEDLAEQRQMVRSQRAKAGNKLRAIIAKWKDASWKIPTAYKCDNAEAVSQQRDGEERPMGRRMTTVSESYRDDLKDHHENLSDIKDNFRLSSRYATFEEFLSENQHYQKMIEEAHVESLKIQEEALTKCKTISFHDDVEKAERQRSKTNRNGRGRSRRGRR